MAPYFSLDLEIEILHRSLRPGLSLARTHHGWMKFESSITILHTFGVSSLIAAVSAGTWTTETLSLREVKPIC